MELTADSLLTVTFTGEGITVRFPPREPLKEAICSCKATGFCRHRLETALHYQVAQGAVTINDFREENPSGYPKIPWKKSVNYLMNC